MKETTKKQKFLLNKTGNSSMVLKTLLWRFILIVNRRLTVSYTLYSKESWDLSPFLILPLWELRVCDKKNHYFEVIDCLRIKWYLKTNSEQYSIYIPSRKKTEHLYFWLLILPVLKTHLQTSMHTNENLGLKLQVKSPCLQVMETRTSKFLTSH